MANLEYTSIILIVLYTYSFWGRNLKHGVFGAQKDNANMLMPVSVSDFT